MPKRLIDDSLLDSRSLEVLSPRAQDAFPRFILLADDFGCFEVNPVILRARGWSRRPDVTEEDVAGWLREYAERQASDPDTGDRLAPVLMVWTHVGRRYAHLTGWSGAHGQKKRAEYDPTAPAGTPGRHGSKRRTPAPPADLLAEVLAGNVRAVDGKPPGTDREDAGNLETEIPSDSPPARELTGNVPGNDREAAGKSMFPAPVVPVPVADPVALLAVAASAAGPAEALEGKAKKPTDPRATEKRASWERLFRQERGEPYRWEGPKDWYAAKKLAPVNADVFEAKALAGLRAQGYGRCSTLAQLGMKWNDLAGGAGLKPRVTAAAADHSQFLGGKRDWNA
jgi:hypothetical protein